VKLITKTKENERKEKNKKVSVDKKKKFSIMIHVLTGCKTKYELVESVEVVKVIVKVEVTI
jgi:hypothetical protein